MKLAAVVLAAGASSRYGAPKQLLRIAGESLVRRAARAALDAGCEVAVITGAHAPLVTAELKDLPLRLLHNADWEQGMGGSIACGFNDLLRRADAAPAALLCLADQPLVGVGELQRLMEQYRAAPNRIIISDYGDARGPPCLFPAEFYAELAALKGPAGARTVLAAHPSRVATAAVPQAAADIDTPEDWLHLNARQ